MDIHNHKPKHSIRADGRTLSMCSLRLHRNAKTSFISSLVILFTQKKPHADAMTNKCEKYDVSSFVTIFSWRNTSAAATKTKTLCKTWFVIIVYDIQPEKGRHWNGTCMTLEFHLFFSSVSLSMWAQIMAERYLYIDVYVYINIIVHIHVYT